MNENTGKVPFLEIVYNGKKIPLDEQEVITLAQKGMNYDKLYEKSNEMGEEIKSLKEANAGLKKIAGELKLSPEDLIKSLEEERTREDISDFSKEHNIPYEYAKRLKDMEGTIEALQKEKEELIPMKKKDEDVKAFKKLYPEVDERSLDPEILNEWEKGERPLKDIYNEVTLRKLLQEKNAKQANSENLNSSTGSALGTPEREEEFTDEMIRNMSDAEFNRNFAKILKQYKKGDR